PRREEREEKMFAGDWSYGDPRDSETVGQRRQRKAGSREGSIHTNSSGEKSLYHSITPSSFFTTRGNLKFNDLCLNKPSQPSNASNSNHHQGGSSDNKDGSGNNSHNNRNENHGAIYRDMGLKSERPQRAPSSPASATSRGKSSVFSIFGKRYK